VAAHCAELRHPIPAVQPVAFAAPDWRDEQRRSVRLPDPAHRPRGILSAMAAALTLDSLLATLELDDLGDDRYRAANLPYGGDVVYGGQLLAQAVVAALHGVEGMSVKTLHQVFLRGARREADLELHVDRVHAGRSFASSTVTFEQGGRPVSRAQVLLSAEDADLIRHADPAPAVVGPEEATPMPNSSAVWEQRVVGGVDVDDPAAVGPPELSVWARFPGATVDPTRAQALLAFATEGLLIATAMRPHAGVGQALAHRTVATSVISHTVTFHEPAPVDDWLLLEQGSPYAGRGRSFGRGDVFRIDGALVASFAQDNLIRAMPS
jgi:acyl-CoA thioesterase-2